MPRLNAMKNVKALRDFWMKTWETAGIEDAELSFKEICLYAKQTHNPTVENVNTLCQQRLLRKPLQYILGEWQFRRLSLKMKPPVFIPRPETEQLAGLVIDHVRSQRHQLDVLEIGCGTGAISLSIAEETSNAQIVAVDTNPEACELATLNRNLCKLDGRVDISHGTLTGTGQILGTELDRKFDIVVSNPPYITLEEMAQLQPEVAGYEDPRALCGGESGLDMVEGIFAFCHHQLKPGGTVYLELGLNQPEELRKRFSTNYYGDLLRFCKSHEDFTNRARFVRIQKVPEH